MCKRVHVIVIPYYHNIFIFAVLERWLIYDCEIECSFVYLLGNRKEHGCSHCGLAI